MDVFEAISSRRSVRDYLDKKIPKADIERILRAAVQAPSARHVLPWKFIGIEDKKKQDRLGELALKRHASGSVRDLHGKNLFHDAPLVILIACEEGGKWFKEDAALAAENAFLAARALGIGSCFIGLAHALNESEEELREAGVPPKHKIFAALAFGYPKAWPPAEKREPNIISWA